MTAHNVDPDLDNDNTLGHLNGGFSAYGHTTSKSSHGTYLSGSAASGEPVAFAAYGVYLPGWLQRTASTCPGHRSIQRLPAWAAAGKLQYGQPWHVQWRQRQHQCTGSEVTAPGVEMLFCTSDCASRGCRSTTVKSAEIADREYQGALDD